MNRRNLIASGAVLPLVPSSRNLSIPAHRDAEKLGILRRMLALQDCGGGHWSDPHDVCLTIWSATHGSLRERYPADSLAELRQMIEQGRPFREIHELSGQLMGDAFRKKFST